MKPAYISLEEETNPGLDYYRLRAEGIQAIQELTGSFWTDYNEHDPGVTILEQLCYAITDLCYRANFDVKDHFYNQAGDDTILKAHEILPCNPLTIHDYRKLIFDQVFELRNIWIVPIDKDSTTFQGLYKILIDIDRSVKGESAKKAIAEKTRKVYCSNRNICEDLETVKILNPFEVKLFADVEVDGSRDIESILAEIYFKVEQYLSPEIKFYSLQEMLDEGYEVNEIFEGPLLKHGFIKTSELQDKPDSILISELIKIVMFIKGVVSVKNLYLESGGKKYDNQISIQEEYVPILKKEENIGNEIKFYRGIIHYHSIDTNLVKRKLNELHSTNKRVYRLEEETLSIPPGNKTDIQSYYSIQNQFPLVYGIGQYGLPYSSDNLRKAQAKQLKGYLLLFEQLMANYLSQVGNVKALFSLKEDKGRTYFFQFLDSIPGIKSLLKERKHEFVDEQDIYGPSYLNYYSGLEQLVTEKDNYLDRRNRFLNYLLSMHGESYTPYSLSQFNYYFNEEEFEKHLIKNKSRLLNAIAYINKNRFKAFNYLDQAFGTENITGMEAKISFLLGLGVNSKEGLAQYKSHSLTEVYKSRNLSQENKEHPEKWIEEGRLEETWTEEFIAKNFDLIDPDDIQKNTAINSTELLNQTLLYQTKLLPVPFLTSGIDITRYQVAEISTENGPIYPVLYNDSPGNYYKIGEFQSEENALQTVLALIADLKEINIESEGLHIVEHILLRPDLHDQNHGILIYDENRKPFLRSENQYSFAERENIIREIKSQLYDFSNYSVETTPDKEFEVHFKTSDEKHHFISLQSNLSVEETHDKMERLYRFISDQDKITAFEDKIGLYIKNTISERIIPEEFFSFRISLILPSWTARFSNTEFRSIIENTIHENKPANIALNCYWLDPAQMEEFETVFLKWLDEKRNPAFNKELMDELNNQLSEILTRYKDECS